MRAALLSCVVATASCVAPNPSLPAAVLADPSLCAPGADAEETVSSLPPVTPDSDAPPPQTTVDADAEAKAALAAPPAVEPLTTADKERTVSDALSDKYSIALGGMLFSDFNSTVNVHGVTVPIGAGINLEDDLGLQSSAEIWRGDFYWRPGRKHRLDISYWQIDRSSSINVIDEFEFQDYTIGPADVQTKFDFNDLALKYTYSFLRRDDAELAIGAGFHVLGIDLGLKGQGTITDSTGTSTPSVDLSASATAPLPVLSSRAMIAISRKWRWWGSFDIFGLKFEDYEGFFTDTRINFEHNTWKHCGFGFGLDLFNLNVDIDAPDYGGGANLNYQALVVYIRGYW